MPNSNLCPLADDYKRSMSHLSISVSAGSDELIYLGAVTYWIEDSATISAVIATMETDVCEDGHL